MNFDTDLAWRRIKRDISNDRYFIRPISLIDIIDSDSANYLSDLQKQFENGLYKPGSVEIIEIPKGKGLIRPGSHLSVADNVFYSCLVGACYKSILNRINWSQNTVDFAYIPSLKNENSDDWFTYRFLSWDKFRHKSLEMLEQGAQYIIITDLTGFYDNIDIPTLISDLKSLDVTNDIVNSISDCLNRWAQINHRGIPQGHSASDLLAKLYLDPVDQGLKNAGFKHLRYVDDFRIFCNSLNEAKNALIELNRLLRKRGLNIQSSKTKILTASEGLKKVEGIQPILEPLSKKYRESLGIQMLSDISGYSGSESPSTSSADGIPTQVLEDTFRTNFLDSVDEKFDKTLFHFIINRLIEKKSDIGLDYCLSILEKHPEETKYILKYSKALTGSEQIKKMGNFLLNFLHSDEAVYDYQNFQFLVWLLENTEAWSEEKDRLLGFCRSIAANNNLPYYLRSIGDKILGLHGNAADLSKLEDKLDEKISGEQKAEVIYCLQKMEKGKRNAKLARIKNEDALVELAANAVKK